MRYVLTPTSRHNALEAVQNAPLGWVVDIKEPTRSLEQNALMWPILDAFAKQLDWPVNGQMVKLSADDWKDLLSAAYKRESARLAMGLDGGVVMLGLRTSRMTKAQFSDFIEFLYAVASERGVDLGANKG